MGGRVDGWMAGCSSYAKCSTEGSGLGVIVANYRPYYAKLITVNKYCMRDHVRIANLFFLLDSRNATHSGSGMRCLKVR